MGKRRNAGEANPDGRSDNERGKLAEDLVESALKILKSRGGISGFLHVDLPGIDFLVLFASRLALPLEVKSSRTGLLKHYKRYKDRWGFYVKIDRDNPEKVANKIGHIIKRATRGFVRTYMDENADKTEE